jgi:tetratricopeptide (TPR) repeat protein
MTAAQKLFQEHAARVGDPLQPIDDFTLWRLRREARAALRDANLEGQWALWLLLGLIEHRLGDVDGALSAYRNASSCKPDDPHPWVNISKVLGGAERPREAMEALQKAEALAEEGSPLWQIILLNRVAGHTKLGEREAAVSAFDQAARATDPRDPAALLRLATSSMVFGREDDAVEYLARHLAAAQGISRGDDLALRVILDAPPALRDYALGQQELVDAVRAVAAREDEPLPADMTTSASVVLSPAAWSRFAELVAE